MRFATCSYQEFRPEMGIPVRSSRGFPRFPLKYDLRHAAASTFPSRPLLGVSDVDEFAPAYRAHVLSRVDQLRGEVQLIADQERAEETGMPLTFLCFERWNKPAPPDQFCHRHTLADVLREVFEVDDVPELGACPPTSTTPAAEPLPLF